MRRAVVAYSVRNRKRKADLCIGYLHDNQLRTVILSGASAGGWAPNEMIIERALLDDADIVCAFDIKMRRSEQWPCVIADGRHLPFHDDAADVVISNAVIEHVGDEGDQRRFVSEHLRVGRHCIITTPNRWFPVESHTSAILRHWSRRWRDSRPEFTRLLSLRELKELLPPTAVVVGMPWSSTFVALIPPNRPASASPAEA